MVKLCKQNALFVKGCVIANGIMDSQGDILYSEDIKKIFTSFNNQDNFEVYHNDIPIQEVSLLENYISTADETIGSQVIPRGSWNCVIRVDNPEVQEGLLTGEFGGLSLNNRIAPKCKGNLSGQVKYEDVKDAECIIPLLISFVNQGANGYGLHVMDYDAYIKKSNSFSKKGAKEMAFNLLEGLKSLLKEAEASEKEDAVIMKEDKADQEKPVETPTEEPVEEETEEEPVVQNEDAAEEETPAEEIAEEEDEDKAEIEKSDETDLESRVAKLEEQIAQLLATDEEVENTTEEVEEVSDEDTPKITKSEKVIVEETTQTNNNYYEMTGRDPLTGLKIRNQSKIIKN